MTAGDAILASLVLRRPEYWIAEIPIVATPILLGASHPLDLGTGFLWEGIALFFLLFHFGDLVNCLADRDRDALYKSHLSRAVYALGVRNVTAQAVLSAVLALGVAFHMTLVSGRWALLGLVVFGLLVAAAYSLPPIHFKARGTLQLVSLWAVIFVIPMAIAELYVRPRVSWELVAVAAGYAALQMGAILVNTAEDYPEDVKFGMRNTIVAYGLVPGIRLASILALAGGAGLLAALAWIARSRGLGLRAGIALLPLAASWLYVTTDLIRLATQISSLSLEEAILRVKARGRRVPVWVTLDAWASFVAAAAYFWMGRPAAPS